MSNPRYCSGGMSLSLLAKRCSAPSARITIFALIAAFVNSARVSGHSMMGASASISISSTR